MISLAGVLLEAELPPGVSARQELKLQVRELTPQRVVLAIQPQSPETQAAVPALAALLVPMPNGGAVRVQDQGGSRARQFADGSHTVTLRYDAPSFGAVDMNFVLDSTGALRLSLLVPSGASFEAAQAGSEPLTQALQRATGGQVSVSVAPRHEPIEVFA
jgi:hypothetical protein